MTQHKQANQIRIIAGKFRGRKIQFASLPGLRPTADRTRETVFNWLTSTIIDANCLDLFAGSGALGIEAISRGASQVTFVDNSPVIISQLKSQLNKLKVDNAIVLTAEIPNAKINFTQPFDIIFLDPPFQKELLQPTIQWLINIKCLKLKAYIYIETETKLDLGFLPENWQILRQKSSSQVNYYLCQVESAG